MTSTRFLRRAGLMLAGSVLMAGMTSLWAQEATTPAEPKHVVKVLHADPRDTEDFAALLGAYGVSVHVSRKMGMIAIGGPSELVDRAEEVFKNLQAERASTRTIPERMENVAITIYLLGVGEGEISAIPAGPLREVVEELKQTFPFKGYTLLETFALRTRVGRDAAITGSLPTLKGEESRVTRYEFSCKIGGIQGDPKALQIGFDGLALELQVPVPSINNPTSFTTSQIAFRTAMEVPDGKIVVVGKAGAPGDSQGYLVVLTAKVVR